MSTTIKDDILNRLEQPLNEITDRILAHEAAERLERTGVKMVVSNWHRETIKLGLIIDLMTALQKCVLQTDTLISMEWKQRRNVIEIDSVIDRDGVRYPFVTEAIYAGGYNIQRLHLRYLIKTKMPRVSGGLANEYKDTLSRLTKIEKIEAEIAKYEDRIRENEYDVAKYGDLTRDELLEAMKTDARRDWFSLKTVADWDSVVYKENFDNDASKYFAEREKWIADDLKSFRYLNVEVPKKDIVKCNESIAKLRKKLEVLLG